MELTEFEVDSIYSRCLMELLQEGYVALFNYKGKNDSEIVLAKKDMIIINGLQMVLSTNLKLLKHRGKATERMSQFAQQRMGGRLLMSTEKQLMSARGHVGTI